MAIEPAPAGHNLIATAQTETGKTLAFVLPVIQALAPFAAHRKACYRTGKNDRQRVAWPRGNGTSRRIN